MNTTAPDDDALVLYAELNPAQIRAAQRRLQAGELRRVATGMLSRLPTKDWPALIARERIRVLSALFPRGVVGPRTAFMGGAPTADGVFFLTYTHTRKVQLPGLTVRLVTGPGPARGDAPMMGRELYFPSQARVLLENLTITRSKVGKALGRSAVEQRLIETCDARGEEALGALRDQARALARTLNLEREFGLLDGIIGTVLGTRNAVMKTAAGKAMAAAIPYDAKRLALFENLAARLRSLPVGQPRAVQRSEAGRANFAFLESYFSNFIEGTEFDVEDARAFVLEGKPITDRPKDSHDIVGVFRQALDHGWANQTLAAGEPALGQLRARHADLMKQRPEVNPGDFKTRANRAGNTEFVAPRLVRGTLVQGSMLLATVPPGTARALMAMFLVAEVHPFTDGNGRVARLVMNAELSAVGACRIMVPTLYREEYLDCLRVLTREGDAEPFLDAMQHAHRWTAAFDYENLDDVIAAMAACNAFEKSRTRHKLLFPKTR